MRGNTFQADPDGGITLAASPDTPGRPVPWRWSVRIAPGSAELAVKHDPTSVAVRRSEHRGEELPLERSGGELLVAVPLQGRYLIGHASEPWHRWLESRDVAVLEGEDGESFLLQPATADARLAVVRLTSTTEQPLRWVP